MRGFIDFVREQGIVGLAIGFLLGGAVSKVVTAFITDIVNPLLGALLGEELKAASFNIGSAEILYGDLLSVMLDFFIIAVVVYIGIKILRIDRLDKKKEVLPHQP